MENINLKKYLILIAIMHIMILSAGMIHAFETADFSTAIYPANNFNPGKTDFTDGYEYQRGFADFELKLLETTPFVEPINDNNHFLPVNQQKFEEDKNIFRIPEPGTILLFGVGLIGLSGFGRSYIKY